MVNGSCNTNTPSINTIAGARLINGYATVISNFVIAIIQNTEATNAETKPESINGSNKKVRYETMASLIPVWGKLHPSLVIRHFKIICPYTVKKSVAKIYK